jgi:hypothetical protein
MQLINQRLKVFVQQLDSIDVLFHAVGFVHHGILWIVTQMNFIDQ